MWIALVAVASAAPLAWETYAPPGSGGVDYPTTPGYGPWTAQAPYDPVLRKTIVYASTNMARYSNAFWAYEDVTHTWELLSWSGSWEGVGNAPYCPTGVEGTYDPISHPGDRHPYNQLSYDTTRGRVMLYGGVWCSGADRLDTWAFDSATTTWMDLTDTDAGTHWEAAMAYDEADDVIVLYGGLGPSQTLDDTWEYSPGTNTWDLAVTTGDPGPRDFPNLAYDPLNEKVVMFGGSLEYGTAALDETWVYDAGTNTWTNPNPTVRPPALMTPPMAGDSRRGLVYLYAGEGQLWAFETAAGTWSQLDAPGGPPLDFGYTTLTYDPDQDELVATGLYGCCDINAWELPLGGLPTTPDPVTDTLAPAAPQHLQAI